MPSDPRRFAAVVIEFKDDDALAAFQRIQAGGLRVEITSTVIGQARELDELATSGDLAVHPKIYNLKLHQYAPYINDMTVVGLRLRAPKEEQK